MADIKYSICMSGRFIELEGVAKLKPCPFCGSSELELVNTHTASCWVECLKCSGQCGGEYYCAKKGKSTKKHFVAAIRSAIENWNRRQA